jgi:nicotinamide mononucleotide transporter
VTNLEISANAVNAASIILAGRNSVHTWWLGVIGCALFGWLFYSTQLYADATLQVFFIGTSVWGWWNWLHGRDGGERAITRSSPRLIGIFAVLGAALAAGYGWLLHRFTDAYAPFIDSSVLAFSVLAQFLLMARKLETWWGWLLVNTLSVPLFASRGLWITAALYAGFWINAVISARHWGKLAGDK